MTRGEEIVEAIEAALTALRQLSYGSYARHDVSLIIDPLGSRVESFLRSVVWPASSRREKFYDLIERARPGALPADQVDHLHGLRELYNLSKHEPSSPLLLGEVIEAVRDACLAVRELIARGTGAVNARFQRELNYHLWVGFWDHYIGGETEVAVMLPGNNWSHVGALDTLHMRMRYWDDLKRVLTAHPRFHLGKAHFEVEIWEDFAAEGDFLNAGIWDGDYGELIRLLAPFEYREIMDSLLPELTRQENEISIGTSLIMAAVDVARSASASMRNEELIHAIKARADSEYALPQESHKVASAASQVAALLASVPFAQWQGLAGPVLCARTGTVMENTLPGPLSVELDGNAFVLRFNAGVALSIMT